MFIGSDFSAAFNQYEMFLIEYSFVATQSSKKSY